jgi:hypothetical protein
MRHPDHLVRGNLLWESSRMMLPEHREQLLERRSRLEDTPMPELDEQQCEQLDAAFRTHQPVRLTVHDGRKRRTLTGVVRKLDLLLQCCTVELATGVVGRIALAKIIDVACMEVDGSEDGPQFDEV